EEDDGSQDWYAGGEHSGMAVRPPPKDDGESEGGGSLVDRILRRAAEGSARAAEGSARAAAGSSDQTETAKPAKFTGRGRALGSGAAEAGAASGAASDVHDKGGDDDDEVAVRELTFWRNGFSIGDGPLFNTEDPRNRQNLEAILQGRAPLDILNVRPGQQVEMKVMSRTGEDYVPPAAPPPQPFAGHGRRLGGISPAISGASSSAIPGGFPQQPASRTGGSSSASASASAGRPITLDPSQRTVQIQIRLADGSRVVARANPSHTIGDLRAFVLSQRPGADARAFVFKTMMPPKVLDNDATTIEEAGIANAAVVQHFV
ncbi:SEP-domain-containing protein, partial [Martensiomyces pterosporus]